jgi:hypothetical protein
VRHLDVKKNKMSWIKKIVQTLEENQSKNSTIKMEYIVSLHKKNKFKTTENINTKE